MSPSAGQFPTATIVMILRRDVTPILDPARQARRQEANDRYGVVSSGMYDGRGLVLTFTLA